MNEWQRELVLDQYEQLVPLIEKFAAGEIDPLAVLSHAGLADSRFFGEQLTEYGIEKISGRISSAELYRRLFACRDKPVAVIDVSRVYPHRRTLRLVNALCRAGTPRRLSERGVTDLPRWFETNTRVLLVARERSVLSRHVRTASPWAQLAIFDPYPEVVHQQVCREGWCDDEEVLRAIESFLPFIHFHSMRYYQQALHLKRQGVDWRRVLAHQWLPNETAWLVLELLCDARLATPKQKIDAFISQGGGSRSTWYAYARKLKGLIWLLEPDLVAC